MRRSMKDSRLALMFLLILAVAVSLAGCLGDGTDGAAGLPGPAGLNGVDGVTGPAGPVTTTNESCMICHTAGKVADAAVAHPAMAEQVNVAVTAVTDLGGGQYQVDYSVKQSSNNAGVSGLAASAFRYYLGDVVPAGTATVSWGTWDTDYVERWAYETSTSGGTFVDNLDGTYSYTFVTAAGSAGAIANAPEYSATHAQRIVVRADARTLGYARAVGVADFDGTTLALIAPQRVLAPATGCKGCHSQEMDKAAHGGSYLDTRACVMCHSPIGTAYGDEMQLDGAWFTNLMHKVHAAIPMDAFATRIGGLGYGAVTYPQPISNCATCHNGDDGMTTDWQSNPTAEACGSCHTAVDFATGTGHLGGAQADNASCSGCHSAADIANVYHTPTPAAADVPEFDVTLSVTAPANGTHYVHGEAPMVTVTLKNHSDGSAVNSSLYTTAQDAAGVTGGGLRVASVYIYGPRAKALPVLATNTMSDPNFDATTSTPTQGHNMFTGGTDPLVMTDATGFKYQMLAITNTMTPGTYMVRVRIGDYGRVGTGDYVIESIATTNIQINTATVENKAAGDACYTCHGADYFMPHNERHSVYFNTDECLSCHDQSGNYAIPIGNRVHAIHDANSDGDIYNIKGGHRDWEEITYPQNVDKCATCHDSGNTSYMTKAFMMPCAGCHVEVGNGVVDHMRQNGGPF